MKNSRAKKIGFAIIGAGAVAAHHVKALQQQPDAKIVCVYRRDEQKAKAFADPFNLPWTTDFVGILNNPNVHALDITLPSGLHSEYGIAGARAGKHIIVEKPIDVTLEKADNLINACKTAGVTLGIISQYRFMNAVLKMQEIIKSGKLGRLLHGEASIKWYRDMNYYNSAAWRGTRELDGGGPFINQGIHFIDLLLSVMGPVKWVYGKTRTSVHDIQVEDIGTAMLEFTSGASGVIQASTATFPGLPARLEIHGTDGTLIIEGERLALLHIRGEKAVRSADVAAGGASAPMAIDVMPFVREFRDIIDAIKQNREPLINGVEARRSLELILAIYKSSNTGQPVILG